MPDPTSGSARRLDTAALTVGLLSVALCALALVSHAGLAQVDGVVVLAALWLVLGLVGLSRALHHLRRSRESSEPPPPAATDAAA